MSLTRFTSDFTDPFMEASPLSVFMNDPFFSRRGFEDPFALVRRDISSGQSFFTPRVDVWDTGDALRVHADLPGVPKENVSIEIQNGNLHIDGQTSEEKEYDKFDSRIRERRFGKFSRVMSLPSDIDPTKVQAEFKNGVLEMNIQKKPESMPRRIQVV